MINTLHINPVTELSNAIRFISVVEEVTLVNKN
jgi:hypothetical protein